MPTVSAHLTGPQLREARQRAHLSQEDAAARLGIPIRTYRSWESDKPPVPHPRHRLILQAFLAELDEGKEAA